MIEVLKQALEALYPISHNSTDDYRGQADKAITSLRQAIAELESQEPVAWRWQRLGQEWVLEGSPKQIPIDVVKVEPLYTNPPQRTWQGLTEEEVDDIANSILTDDPVLWWRKLSQAIEAKLKEKNNG